VTIKGPKFRSAKIHPNRKLGFNPNRHLGYRKKGVTFRKGGVKLRTRGVKFRKGGMMGIDLAKDEDPIKMNNMGIKYYNKGRYKTAREYFNRALAVAPQFKEAKKNRLYAIQMMRQNREQELVRREKMPTKPYRSWRSTSSSSAVEVHPLDYRASRFTAYHQYGRIQHKDDRQNQMGWGRARR
jgi:tetratricopeptide (TPR) repeat protein